MTSYEIQIEKNNLPLQDRCMMVVFMGVRKWDVKNMEDTTNFIHANYVSTFCYNRHFSKDQLTLIMNQDYSKNTAD